MTAEPTPRTRIAAAAVRMAEALDDVVDAPAWAMDAGEAGATLLALDQVAARVEELRARVAVHAERVGAGPEAAASSATAWFAHERRQTRLAARRVFELGRRLESHDVVRAALAAGELVAEQARVIVDAVEALPADLPAEVASRAETHLVVQARDHDARALTVLGRRLLEVVAPELADAHEAALLEREERQAARRCWLTCRDDGEGGTIGAFRIPTVVAGAALTKLLWALASPKHLRATEGAGVDVTTRPTPERLGEAFCELITRYPADRLPRSGDLNAAVVVMIDEESLSGRLERAGLLDTGQRISPAAARRIACEARVVPLVLGGDSQPLDVGRARRLHTGSQRLAMLVRDRGCAAEGCERTGALHAHHVVAWSEGGETSVTNGVLLCSWHHHRAHDARFDVRHLPTGRVAFYRRT